MNTNNRDSLIENFLKQEIRGKYSRNKLSGDASSRSYERIKTEKGTLILMDSPAKSDKMESFIFVDGFLIKKQLSAPKIHAKDIRNGFLLLEDFGDLSFNNALKAHYSEAELYKHAADVLIKLHQIKPPKELPEHSSRSLEEIERFTQWYVPLFYSKEEGDKIGQDFTGIWQQLLAKMDGDKFICLYDYHADNLMWLEGQTGVKKVGLLDFQDAVCGSESLDLAALLQDIRRDVSKNIKDEMLEYFIKEIAADKKSFMRSYYMWGAHWNTRILGTFARLVKRDGKIRYLDFIPTVWSRLENNLHYTELTPLKSWFNKYFPEDRRHVS